MFRLVFGICSGVGVLISWEPEVRFSGGKTVFLH
jgi:hypothetical protein